MAPTTEQLKNLYKDIDGHFAGNVITDKSVRPKSDPDNEKLNDLRRKAAKGFANLDDKEMEATRQEIIDLTELRKDTSKICKIDVQSAMALLKRNTSQAEIVGGSFTGAGVQPTKLNFEIADDDQERHQGLMDRTSLDEDAGMLFCFPDEAVHTFWMHHTRIPLDMIFLDKDMHVVGMLENVPPNNDQSRYPGSKPSKYVVELNAGTARKLGIKNGSRLMLQKPAKK